MSIAILATVTAAQGEALQGLQAALARADETGLLEAIAPSLSHPYLAQAFSAEAQAFVEINPVKELPAQRGNDDRETNTQSAIVPYKGYELLVESDGRKTTSCKVRLATVGVSKELGTITAAKEWVTTRDALPMERREPFEALTKTETVRDEIDSAAKANDSSPSP